MNTKGSWLLNIDWDSWNTFRCKLIFKVGWLLLSLKYELLPYYRHRVSLLFITLSCIILVCYSGLACSTNTGWVTKSWWYYTSEWTTPVKEKEFDVRTGDDKNCINRFAPINKYSERWGWWGIAVCKGRHSICVSWSSSPAVILSTARAMNRAWVGGIRANNLFHAIYSSITRHRNRFIVFYTSMFLCALTLNRLSAAKRYCFIGWTRLTTCYCRIKIKIFLPSHMPSNNLQCYDFIKWNWWGNVGKGFSLSFYPLVVRLPTRFNTSKIFPYLSPFASHAEVYLFMRLGGVWKWLFTNTVNVKGNIRAIMSFRVFTPIFLIKVLISPECKAGDGRSENIRDATHADTNEQHPLIYHICSFILPISKIKCALIGVYKGRKNGWALLREESSFTLTGSWR